MKIICMTTNTDGCHVDFMYDNWQWRLPYGCYVWQPTVTAVMWVLCMTNNSDSCHMDLCMTSDSDGCHVDFMYDNQHWQLPCGLFIWQPTLIALKWILCMTTDSDGCQVGFLYDNRQWRLPCGFMYDNRHWWLPCGFYVWQPTVTAAMWMLGMTTDSDSCHVDYLL